MVKHAQYAQKEVTYKMANLNPSIVAQAVKVQRMMLVASIAAVNSVDKRKLDDSADKALYVRFERNIHNSCEALDAKSYRTIEHAMEGAAYKAARAELAKAKQAPKTVAPKVDAPSETN